MSDAGGLFVHTIGTDVKKATLTVDAAKKSAHTVNPYLYGKFSEHLGHNIYHGMDAQILRNPTFGKWRFGAGEDLVDGGERGETNPEKIAQYIERWSHNLALPPAAKLLESYKDSLAFQWSRLGDASAVRYSPDVGPRGGRAQRIEILKAQANAELGVAQFMYLPTHRVRSYEYRIIARASTPATVTFSLSLSDKSGSSQHTLASSGLALSNEWKVFKGVMTIGAKEDLPNDAIFRVALTAGAPANIVVSRVLLYPADHVNYSDPDVIRMLKESKLPLLRWPGGNFVSGYRWRDGVGPVDQRPTLPNPAWDGLEYNFFGTDEFMAYCKTIGCEPLICVNAGDGTPEEAAAWIEYCNGPVSSPMGALRAKNGHAQPYGVKYWEAGNELYGTWQVSWTYSGGNADRYARFAKAMLAADPTIQLQACGGIGDANGEWNQRLLAECGSSVRCITDHLLNGVRVNANTDPAELYHAFMGQSVALGRSYRELRARMIDAGIREPRLSITECQLFPRWNGDVKPDGKLSPATLINPATIAEAIFTSTLIHECIRLGDFVEMFTHSAIVNHGGGLRKTRERVWANPVHYAHEMGSALMNGTPVAVALTSGAYSTDSDFLFIPKLTNVPVIDAMAVINASNDALVVMLVHRAEGAGAIQLALDVKNVTPGASAEVVTLADELPHGANTREEPERIKPRTSTVRVNGGRLSISVPPYSVMRLTLPLK